MQESADINNQKWEIYNAKTNIIIICDIFVHFITFKKQVWSRAVGVSSVFNFSSIGIYMIYDMALNLGAEKNAVCTSSKELLTLPEHLISPPIFSGVHVTRSFMCMFCRSLFVLFLLATVLSILLLFTGSDYTLASSNSSSVISENIIWVNEWMNFILINQIIVTEKLTIT